LWLRCSKDTNFFFAQADHVPKLQRLAIFSTAIIRTSILSHATIPGIFSSALVLWVTLVTSNISSLFRDTGHDLSLALTKESFHSLLLSGISGTAPWQCTRPGCCGRHLPPPRPSRHYCWNHLAPLLHGVHPTAPRATGATTETRLVGGGI